MADLGADSAKTSDQKCAGWPPPPEQGAGERRTGARCVLRDAHGSEFGERGGFSAALLPPPLKVSKCKCIVTVWLLSGPAALSPPRQHQLAAQQRAERLEEQPEDARGGHLVQQPRQRAALPARLALVRPQRIPARGTGGGTVAARLLRLAASA